ncbi:MAG: Rv3235 family protein [Rothia sp. (in: high G+C Gram-positive bacteria)]|uniref:Rv3235 family protein n=1 Tax=Rothia sp. (in: high G+C Gram-positive bacteria) TaxID=1885016 RepID=UPI0026FC9155|nr:Rv3235 family protein [Rothia sp. (in: high G+C Gram-positive bacteria)]
MKTAFPERDDRRYIIVEATEYAERYAPYFEKSQPTEPTVNLSFIDQEEQALEQLGVRIGTAAIEVFMGRRPQHHLAPWMTTGCYRTLEKQLEQAKAAIRYRQLHYPQAAHPRKPPASIRPRRIIVQKVADTAYEMSLLVTDDVRTRAIALRAERKRGRWKIATLAIA